MKNNAMLAILSLFTLILFSLPVITSSAQEPKTRTKQPTQGCDDPRISATAKELLVKYQLDCPITITNETRWYKKAIVKKFLAELLNTSFPGRVFLGSRPELSPERREQPYAGVRPDREQPRMEPIWISDFLTYLLVDVSAEDKTNVEDLVVPLFADPKDVLYIKEKPDERLAQQIAQVKSIPGESMKPEFTRPQSETTIRGATIDVDRVWKSMLNAAESVSGLRLNPKTETKNELGRKIKSFSRQVPVNDPGFAVFEEVEIELRPSGSDVTVIVISNVCRRRLSSRTCVEVRLENDSEIPCMAAILKALSK